MRGKVARQLRKELGYKISQKEKDKRQYHDLEYRVVRPIYSFDPEKKTISIVEREVSAFTRECVSGDRKMYKYLKRKWYNMDYETQLQKLPEVDSLVELATTILKDPEITGSKEETNE